ncbi:MAG: GNAT family N-acetyltransferase [Actinobacteria bacterium]|nr:GNAT family N-acetyltransferase [Actinomycetota bacterium]
MFQVRDMAPGEEAAVLALVMAGFDEFVRPDFTDEGVAEFERSARSFVLDRPDDHFLAVAEEGDRLLGMLDLRDGSHIALFFVDAGRQGRGIGRSLLAHAIERCRVADPDVGTMSVNSSPWAVPAYERLGFVAVDVESELKGIRFVPMIKQL